MKIGLCIDPVVTLAWSSLPCDYLEANVQVLLQPEAEEGKFNADVARLGSLRDRIFAANCFLPGDLKVTGPAVDWDRLARYAETAFRRAATVGIRYIVFGSGGARQVPDGWSLAEGFEQYVQALKVCAPLAGKHGVTLVVEPLCRAECNLVNTVLEGAAAVARVNHPNIRLLADIFHMTSNGECADDIVKVGPWLSHVHVAEKGTRTSPGVGGDDFRPFLAALQRAGYPGMISIEAKLSADPHAECGVAAAYLREQMADVAAGIAVC